MHFYSIETPYGKSTCTWLTHESCFTRKEWLGFVRDAVAACTEKVTAESVVAHLCASHGFSVYEPLYSAWVDLGLSVRGGLSHIDESEAFIRGRSRYVEIATGERVGRRREERRLADLCRERAKYAKGQKVHVGEVEEPPVDDDGLTFCKKSGRTGVVKASELRGGEDEVRYHIVFDDYPCEKCWVQCWMSESDLAPA